MTYVSVLDPTNPTTSPVTGIFNMPQTDPNLTGYIGQITDTDPRIATFIAAQQTQAQGAQ